MSEPTVYAICSTNCKYETYTKEQFLTVLQQAIENQSLEGINSDAGFITKIKEMNANKQVKIWLGTQAEYEALATKDADTLYIFTDDTTLNELDAAVADALKTIAEILDGTIVVPKAKIFEVGEWQTCTSWDNDALTSAGTYQIKCSELNLDFGYVWFKGPNNYGDTSSSVNGGVCMAASLPSMPNILYFYRLYVSYSGRLTINKHTVDIANGTCTAELNETATIEYRRIGD